ncbi:hypothetical protein QUF55_08175, partial [Clostridiaceae bacterium HSG29]|nr:hypothetical protein [Clostridiaceae bacterium HSG29]
MKFFWRTILVIIIIMLSSIFAFADVTEFQYELNDYLEIINPSFDESGDIFVKNNLFLSMNIKQDADLYLTLKKYVPVMDEMYFDKIINGEIDRTELIENIANRVLEINKVDEIYENDELFEEKLLDEKEEIIVVIDRYFDEYFIKEEFEQKLVNSTKEMNLFGEENLTFIEEYNSIRSEYLDSLDSFNEAKDEYVELFKVNVIDKDLIVSVGVMPYYEKTIENITPGKYEMIIELAKDEDEVYLLNETEFNIKIKEEVILVEPSIEIIQPEISEPMELIQPSIN